MPAARKGVLVLPGNRNTHLTVQSLLLDVNIFKFKKKAGKSRPVHA
jgi:hypothetical protein